MIFRVYPYTLFFFGCNLIMKHERCVLFLLLPKKKKKKQQQQQQQIVGSFPMMSNVHEAYFGLQFFLLSYLCNFKMKN